MSIEKQKEMILRSLDSKIQKALLDGKPHRIEIEIKHSKLTEIKVINRHFTQEWINDPITEKKI